MGSHLWALSSPSFISLPETSLGRTNLWALVPAGGLTCTLRSAPRCRHHPGHTRGRSDRQAAESSCRYAEVKRETPRRGFFPPQKVGHSIRRAWRSAREVSGTARCWSAGRGDTSRQRISLGASLALRSSHPRSSEDTPAASNSQCPPQRGVPRGDTGTPEPAAVPVHAELRGQSRRGLAGRAGPVPGTRRALGPLLHPALPRCALEKIKKKRAPLHLIKKVNTRAV